MNKRTLSRMFAIALGICAVVAPSYAGPIDVWFIGSTGGTVQVTGSGASSSLYSVSIPFTSLYIAGVADSGDNGTWSLTSTSMTLSVSGGVDTLTVSGTIGSCGGCIGTSNLGGFTGILETLTYTPVLAYTSNNPPTTHGYNVNGANTSLILNYGAPTSITDYLLSDLGEAGATTTVNSTSDSANGTGSGTPTSGRYSFSTSSSNMDQTLTPAPEPASFLLFGIGLAGISWFARRRSTRA